MTIVNHDTGEITETLDETSARRLTDRIRLLADTVADQLDKMAALIEEARTGSAWLALGYSSWTAYVSEEFSGVLPRLEREPRREFVRELAAHGMSTRAIAPVVGVSHETVAQDIASPVRNLTPQTPPDEDNGEASASPKDPEPRPVTGIDGKTYNRPESKPKPVLTDSAADYDNAEKASKSLSNAIAKLLEFQHPNMRAAMSRYWSMASKEVPPTPRRDVTPEQMRVAAQGLLDLADEWSTS